MQYIRQDLINKIHILVAIFPEVVDGIVINLNTIDVAELEAKYEIMNYRAKDLCELNKCQQCASQIFILLKQLYGNLGFDRRNY